MPEEPTLVDWLKECLNGAEEMLPWTRGHFPNHQGEVIAEVAFFAAAVEFATSGMSPTPGHVSPEATVINSMLKAADHWISRADETLASGRLPISRVREIAAQRDSWQRSRKFVEEY